jgi:hypothetical protein
MDLKEINCEDLDWIKLAQDRAQRRAFMSAIMKLRFHKMREISWPAEQLSVTQEERCSMKLAR